MSVARWSCDARALLTAVVILSATTAGAAPLTAHPSNGRYLLFKGKPTVLITSAEHYGAVLNLDFDYGPYLRELANEGLNLTRTFSGTYLEAPGSFGIEKNTLAPSDGRYIGPWARSTTPGYPAGGNKFDLTKFDDAYFARLKDFVGKARDRAIVVEYVFFCPFYGDAEWALSPLKASNNVNGAGNLDRASALTLDNGPLLSLLDAFVRKVAAELNAFDNLYYEIANEPYYGIADEFQDHITATLIDAEAGLGSKHLIARNYCENTCTASPKPQVSIINIHYAHPPDVVKRNYGLKRVLACDETGFEGTGDDVYRQEGWAFILAGGAIYNNLDYSFTADNENGTFHSGTSPGGGSATLRAHLKVLKSFIEQFDFVHMAPDASVIKSGVPGAAHVLVKAGQEYAVYLQGGSQANLQIDLPASTYTAQWINVKTGAAEKTETFAHRGGTHTLVSPAYPSEIALGIKASLSVDARSGVDGGTHDGAARDGMSDGRKDGVATVDRASVDDGAGLRAGPTPPGSASGRCSAAVGSAPGSGCAFITLATLLCVALGRRAQSSSSQVS